MKSLVIFDVANNISEMEDFIHSMKDEEGITLGLKNYLEDILNKFINLQVLDRFMPNTTNEEKMTFYTDIASYYLNYSLSNTRNGFGKLLLILIEHAQSTLSVSSHFSIKQIADTLISYNNVTKNILINDLAEYFGEISYLLTFRPDENKDIIKDLYENISDSYTNISDIINNCSSYVDDILCPLISIVISKHGMNWKDFSKLMKLLDNTEPSENTADLIRHVFSQYGNNYQQYINNRLKKETIERYIETLEKHIESKEQLSNAIYLLLYKKIPKHIVESVVLSTTSLGIPIKDLLFDSTKLHQEIKNIELIFN